MTLATRTAFLIEYLWHTTRGDQGHLMPRERVAPHSEVIRAIVLDDSLYFGGPHQYMATISAQQQIPSTMPTTVQNWMMMACG